jgi:predicted ATPase
MSYSYSQVDRKNLNWFESDYSKRSLRSIAIAAGSVRGLSNVTIQFTYPITAIAGRNGTGKSTVLALAACGFHNHPNGYRILGRGQSYHTFADFFVQSSDDVPIDGVRIRYGILHNGWKISPQVPKGFGLGHQERVKRKGGRWNDYAQRVKRTVVYLGVERVVPHYERASSKRQRGAFAGGAAHGWEDQVREIVGRILQRPYSSFVHKAHSKYRIGVVRRKGIAYSGFNMGAGESALFELISVIHECPVGSLFLIDEIELGLHEDAQERLVHELKQLCCDRGIQVICTTHSARVLDALPPEGRVYLERTDRSTVVIAGISSQFATKKLGGRKAPELDVLVEDAAATSVVYAVMNFELRTRTDVIEVGSAAAVMRHMAARYLERDKRPDVAILLDGDQRNLGTQHVRTFLGAIERKELHADAEKWCKERLGFLCGDTWPEKWVLDACASNEPAEVLGKRWGASPAELIDILQQAALAGKHNEYHTVAALTGLIRSIIERDLAEVAMEFEERERQALFDHLTEKVALTAIKHAPQRRDKSVT